MKKMLGVLLVFAMVCTFAAAAHGQVCSTFDSGMEGWTCIGHQCSWSDTGGNPDGYLRYVDTSGVLGEAVAPPAYLGDLSRYDGIMYDHKIISTGKIAFYPYQITIAGPAGTAIWESDDLQISAWKTLIARWDDPDWVVDGEWSEILADVLVLKIRLEQVYNGATPWDIDGIDNVCLFTDCGGCVSHAQASVYGTDSIRAPAILYYLIIAFVPIGYILVLRRIVRRKK